VSPEDNKPAKQQDEQRLAEARVRSEMARQRRQEEAQLQALKIGCFGISALIVIALAIAFFV
jgi:hypothetical protein